MDDPKFIDHAVPHRNDDRDGATPMGYSDYKCFRFGFDSGVAFVSINHPPINLLDDVLSAEFDRLGRELEADESVRVVGLQGALPDFFIAPSGLGRVGAPPPKGRPIRATFVLRR